MFFLIWAAIGVAMAAVLYEPTFVIAATWFRRDRNKAMAVLTFVGGLASVVFLPLASWLEQSFGWRECLVILAAIMAVTTIVPIGQNVSQLLPISHCGVANCRSRAETSLITV